MEAMQTEGREGEADNKEVAGHSPASTLGERNEGEEEKEEEEETAEAAAAAAAAEEEEEEEEEDDDDDDDEGREFSGEGGIKKREGGGGTIRWTQRSTITFRICRRWNGEGATEEPNAGNQ